VKMMFLIITIIIKILIKKDVGGQKHTNMKWYKLVCKMVMTQNMPWQLLLPFCHKLRTKFDNVL
jgi:hypothetical protein